MVSARRYVEKSHRVCRSDSPHVFWEMSGVQAYCDQSSKWSVNLVVFVLLVRRRILEQYRVLFELFNRALG